MRSIMSINSKFMIYSPYELVNIVLENSNSLGGFEISIDTNKQNEIEYLKQLAILCKNNNLHFQIHGNSNLDLNKQYEFLDMLENINIFNYKINVVMHSINSDNIDETIEYMKNLLNYIDNNKITISLENLNENRPNKDIVIPIVSNINNLYMTYDIGHEIADNSNPIDIDKNLIILINNIHIHTYNNYYSFGYDHKPIFKNDINWNKIVKSIIYLRYNGYNESIVFEYDLYACPGNNILEKIISYCKSMDYVWERINI